MMSFIVTIFKEIPVLNASLSALGLHCLPMFILRDGRHKWIEVMCSEAFMAKLFV